MFSKRIREPRVMVGAVLTVAVVAQATYCEPDRCTAPDGTNIDVQAAQIVTATGNTTEADMQIFSRWWAEVRRI